MWKTHGPVDLLIVVPDDTEHMDMENVEVERACAEVEPATTTSADDASRVEPPACFHCPIMHELMEDPVMTVDGQVYERSAIEEWLAKNDTSPLTGEHLPMKMLIPCVPLRGMIREFVERRGDWWSWWKLKSERETRSRCEVNK